MRRVIHSVPFLVYSPSFLVLDLRGMSTRIKTCSLSFTGAEWKLEVVIGDHMHRMAFASREAAISAMRGAA